MYRDSIARYLACQPPQVWPTAIQQATEIEHYLRKVSTVSPEAIASKFNVGRRQFFHILARFRASQECDSLSFRHGRHSLLPQRQNALIEQAIAELGENSLEAEVFAKVLNDCETEGISPPSMAPIRARMSRAPTKPNLVQRLGRQADLVIDHCKLDLSAQEPKGEALPVFVCGIIEMETGAVLHHLVTTSQPSLDEAVALLEMSSKLIQTSDRPLILLSSIDLPRTPGSRSRIMLDQLKLVFHRKETGSAWPGRAWTATFGRRLGRIPFRHRHLTTPSILEPVPMRYIQDTIGLLIARANART